MRTTKDRIRHALSFEIIALAIVTPVGARFFDQSIHDFGVVAVVSATIATVWNYIFNLAFDHAKLWLTGEVRKSIPVRVLHAVLFEAGLLLVLLPFIAWYLDISLLDAFLLDVALAGFYIVYAFVFNWAYDVVFPLPAPRPEMVRDAD